MGIAVAIKKVKRNLNDYGICVTFKKSLLHLLGQIYLQRTYRIYRRDLRSFQRPEPSTDGFAFKVIGAGDTDVIRQIEDMEEWLQNELPGRLSQGLCVAAFDGARVVGFNLVAFQKLCIPLLNMNKRLRADQAWSEQITVLKAYRKQGLATALRYCVFSELRQRGFRALYGGALISNVPSLKSAEKVGFKFIADVRYLKVLMWGCYKYRRIRNVGH